MKLAVIFRDESLKGNELFFPSGFYCIWSFCGCSSVEGFWELQKQLCLFTCAGGIKGLIWGFLYQSQGLGVFYRREQRRLGPSRCPTDLLAMEQSFCGRPLAGRVEVESHRQLGILPHFRRALFPGELGIESFDFCLLTWGWGFRVYVNQLQVEPVLLAVVCAELMLVAAMWVAQGTRFSSLLVLQKARELVGSPCSLYLGRSSIIILTFAYVHSQLENYLCCLVVSFSHYTHQDKDWSRSACTESFLSMGT